MQQNDKTNNAANRAARKGSSPRHHPTPARRRGPRRDAIAAAAC